MMRCFILALAMASLHCVSGLAILPTRREALASMFVSTAAATLIPNTAHAANADCYKDCYSNCQQIAPNNGDYCQTTCQDYCSQSDRTDGLSGSISNAGGEVGILGGTFGTGTVVKNQDKPPAVKIPGLDFLSNDGKKLLGY